MNERTGNDVREASVEEERGDAERQDSLERPKPECEYVEEDEADLGLQLRMRRGEVADDGLLQPLEPELRGRLQWPDELNIVFLEVLEEAIRLELLEAISDSAQRGLGLRLHGMITCGMGAKLWEL